MTTENSNPKFSDVLEEYLDLRERQKFSVMYNDGMFETKAEKLVALRQKLDQFFDDMDGGDEQIRVMRIGESLIKVKSPEVPAFDCTRVVVLPRELPPMTEEDAIELGTVPLGERCTAYICERDYRAVYAKIVEKFSYTPSERQDDFFIAQDSPKLGWNVNSAPGVTVIHLPTGIKVHSDTERSVHSNKAKCIAEINKVLENRSDQ